MEQLADVWLTRDEVAARQKIPVKTLAQWASQRRGPAFRKFGGHCRYRLSDVIAWENAQVMRGDCSIRDDVGMRLKILDSDDDPRPGPERRGRRRGERSSMTQREGRPGDHTETDPIPRRARRRVTGPLNFCSHQCI